MPEQRRRASRAPACSSRCACARIPDERFPGEVFFVSPTLDPADAPAHAREGLGAEPGPPPAPGPVRQRRGSRSRSARTRCWCPESARGLRPRGHLRLARATTRSRERVPVELGLRKDGRVEVRAGLAPGDAIVAAGHPQGDRGPQAARRRRRRETDQAPRRAARRGAAGAGLVKISEVCIERPVLATVMSLVIVLFGAIALPRLPNRELPDVDPPIVSVTTVFPGAAPEVVETSVTAAARGPAHRHRGRAARHLAEPRAGLADHRRVRARPRRRGRRQRRARPRRARAQPAARGGRGADRRQARRRRAAPIMWLALSGDALRPDRSSRTIAETADQGPARQAAGRLRRDHRRRAALLDARLDRQPPAHRARPHHRRRRRGARSARTSTSRPGRVEGATREFTVRTLGELRTRRGLRGPDRRRR